MFFTQVPLVNKIANGHISLTRHDDTVINLVSKLNLLNQESKNIQNST